MTDACQENRWDPKDPEEVITYFYNFNDALDDGDSIAEYVVDIVNPDESGITNEADAEADGFISVKISGGTAGTIAKIKFTVTTAHGQTDVKTVPLAIRER